MTDLGDQIYTIFNLCEGVFWIVLGLGFAVAAARSRRNRNLLVLTSLLFVAFGPSDFVEVRTPPGSPPWWLLFWKGATVLGLIAVYRAYRRRRTIERDCLASSNATSYSIVLEEPADEPRQPFYIDWEYVDWDVTSGKVPTADDDQEIPHE